MLPILPIWFEYRNKHQSIALSEFSGLVRYRCKEQKQSFRSSVVHQKEQSRGPRPDGGNETYSHRGKRVRISS